MYTASGDTGVAVVVGLFLVAIDVGVFVAVGVLVHSGHTVDVGVAVFNTDGTTSSHII